MNRQIDPSSLQKFCENILKKCGMSRINSITMSKILVTTDMWGIFTHGTKNLYGYIKKKCADGVSFINEPSFISECLSIAVIDGNNTMGYISSDLAMRKACQYAEKNGIGMVSVKNSCHYGASGYYANIAAEQGMIGIALSNVDKKMTVPGAKGMIMGHNPFAMAAPATIIPSVILDISSSNVASLKVLKAKAEGKQIPNTWISDKNGLPTTDPSKYPEEGALLPFGNHKGYGIALFIELLTSAILGKENSTNENVRSWCFEMDKPNNVCHTFIAINPDAMGNKNFSDYTDELIRDLHNAPLADGCYEITVPGENMWKKYNIAKEKGLILPKDVLIELEKLAKEYEEPLNIYYGELANEENINGKWKL